MCFWSQAPACCHLLCYSSYHRAVFKHVNCVFRMKLDNHDTYRSSMSWWVFRSCSPTVRVQRKKPSEMQTAKVPASSASHFSLLSGCCWCTVGAWKTLETWAPLCSLPELSAWRGMLQQGQSEADEGWWMSKPGYSPSPSFPHYTRTAMTASRPPHAS